MKKNIYLPGLNGIRAIAALAVVVSHITISLQTFGLNNRIFGTDNEGNAKGLDLAGYGVTMFFTLSGFLITYLLLKEKESGSIKIKDFYMRRVLRIWPLYYMYFIIAMAVVLLYALPYNAGSIPFYIFLAANIPFIQVASLPLLYHYWSLGVEEQFYLFFPWIARSSKLLKISVLLIGVLLSLKALFWVLDRQYHIPLPYRILDTTRFHIMLFGVVAAILYYKDHLLFMAFTTIRITQALAAFCLILVVLNSFHIASVIDHEIISLVSVCIIIGQITKSSFINLENRLLDFIGKISYGLYVIHPLVIFLLSKAIGKFQSDSIFNYVVLYSAAIGATIALAYISYTFYEQPFLRLKKKYSTVHSSSTKEKTRVKTQV
jgi:peptidoglycan/LPS O-acetylase OafA/YrhL